MLSIATPRNASLINTIGAGFRALHRRLWVISIPAGLSTYLWLGPPLALGVVLGQVQSDLQALVRTFGGGIADWERLAQRMLASDIRVVFAWLNFVPVLAPAPGALPEQPGTTGGVALFAASLAVINLLALLCSGCFLTLLGEAVSGERPGLLVSLRRALQVAAEIVAYLLALAGVGLVLALPFIAISAIVIVMLPSATIVVLLAWYIALFWAYVYTGFAPEAILVSRSGPMRAIYNSVHIVRRNMPGTLGLLMLSFVIVSGLGIIWGRLASSPPGLALAIIGSAYVGSGLSAARIEFYRERLAQWAMGS